MNEIKRGDIFEYELSENFGFAYILVIQYDVDRANELGEPIIVRILDIYREQRIDDVKQELFINAKPLTSDIIIIDKIPQRGKNKWVKLINIPVYEPIDYVPDLKRYIPNSNPDQWRVIKNFRYGKNLYEY